MKLPNKKSTKFSPLWVHLTASFFLVSIGMSSLAATPVGDAKTSYRRPVIFAGETRALDSTPIFVPPSNSSPVAVRYFVQEGTPVKKGEVILRVDSQGAADFDRVELEMVQTRERGLRDVADLEVKSIDAERNLGLARAALAKAKVDAALPKSQISALDFDKYQAELARAKRDLEVKLKSSDASKESIAHKREDSELALKKLQIQAAYLKAQSAQAEVRAERSGVVVHGYDAWNGKRLDEGGNAHVGALAGQIMGEGSVDVQAWILEADRPFIKEGDAVLVQFDALVNQSLTGKVTRISGAPEPRAIWGTGHYFKVEIKLPENHGLKLAHGMSVSIAPVATTALQVHAQPEQKAKHELARLAASKKELILDGEVLSRQSVAVSPPNIQHIWEYTLVMLAPEGSLLKAGDVAAIFEANDVQRNLDTLKSQFKEKQRAVEKLKLDQAEAERVADLLVSEAKSNAEKADRKASMPKELVKRIDYDKLVVDRELNTQLLQLAIRQREAQQRLRLADYRGAQSEMAQIKNNIDVLEKGLKGLTAIAKKGGTVIHNAGYDGEKYATGSRIFMGGMVASIADPEHLFVQAKVPEAQVGMLQLGQIASVTLPGTNTVVSAKLIAMGSVFHGKSRNQPIIVRDVELEFVEAPKNFKPGAAVQIKFSPSAVSEENKVKAKQAQSTQNRTSGAKG